MVLYIWNIFNLVSLLIYKKDSSEGTKPLKRDVINFLALNI
jgi:hypothetical protein